jgi:hypothetical protein
MMRALFDGQGAWGDILDSFVKAAETARMK